MIFRNTPGKTVQFTKFEIVRYHVVIVNQFAIFVIFKLITRVI